MFLTDDELDSPPPRRRHGIALCLSGGGYRAALFHLGALRRLNELGILTQVETITSVSGGSIIAAHLATRASDWPESGQVIEEWDQTIAAPFRTFVSRNVRTGPLLSRAVRPWRWFQSGSAVEELAHEYERHLTTARLRDLPKRPRFVICATDMVFGVNWVFDSAPGGGAPGRTGDYQAGYSAFPDWPVARAVAASSCCPPFFDPLPVALDPRDLKGGMYGKANRHDLVAKIQLSDGGIYDNMGLEPVWKSHRHVLVSDGGAIFQASPDRGLVWRTQRYSGIMDRQNRAQRKRRLIAGFEAGELSGAYWGIGSAPDPEDDDEPTYSMDLIEEVISRVRTDLDAFSSGEAFVLENHGYLMAEYSIRERCPDLIRMPAAPKAPHPEWMKESVVRRELATSHQRSLLGRR